ncbi:class I SAM-dependent methyltransferase [Bradyrhizobium sp.]|uniref:class I SAM-dependent methyltransferase n=1 Tax=Bradyrhizobium sp. TaxID=376 RepID=UPI002DFA11B9|nr:class I SAM-dependent methyltransferase [Bradyrhizobium sp.]
MIISTATNAQYNVARPGSAPQRVTARMRHAMYDRFLLSARPQPQDKILDVGATSDQVYDFSNYLEAWYPHKSNITAVGIDDAQFLEELYPGITFRKADGRDLPFADGTFDVVHSSAVLEHVGSRENQLQFIRELSRVARRAVFITTPNRWFPVEVHTVLPFVHWLPAPAFRAILRRLGHDMLSREENLNLVGAGDLRRMCRDLALADVEIDTVRLWGISSNLLLTIRKTQG